MNDPIHEAIERFFEEKRKILQNKFNSNEIEAWEFKTELSKLIERRNIMLKNLQLKREKEKLQSEKLTREDIQSYYDEELFDLVEKYRSKKIGRKEFKKEHKNLKYNCNTTLQDIYLREKENKQTIKNVEGHKKKTEKSDSESIEENLDKVNPTREDIEKYYEKELEILREKYHSYEIGRRQFLKKCKDLKFKCNNTLRDLHLRKLGEKEKKEKSIKQKKEPSNKKVSEYREGLRYNFYIGLLLIACGFGIRHYYTYKYSISEINISSFIFLVYMIDYIILIITGISLIFFNYLRVRIYNSMVLKKKKYNVRAYELVGIILGVSFVILSIFLIILYSYIIIASFVLLEDIFYIKNIESLAYYSMLLMDLFIFNLKLFLILYIGLSLIIKPIYKTEQYKYKKSTFSCGPIRNIRKALMIFTLIMILSVLFLTFVKVEIYPSSTIFDFYTSLSGIEFMTHGGWIGIIIVLNAIKEVNESRFKRSILSGFIGCGLIGLNLLYLNYINYSFQQIEIIDIRFLFLEGYYFTLLMMVLLIITFLFFMQKLK